MAFTITDEEITVADGETINDDAEHTSSEIDRGNNVQAKEATLEVSISGMASVPTDDNPYFYAKVASLSDTGGTLFDDEAPTVPVTVDGSGAVNIPFRFFLPQGKRYFKIIIGNSTGVNTDASAVSATLSFQKITS